MSKFLTPNNPLLTKSAEEIHQAELNSVQVKEIIEKMLRVAYGEQKDRAKPILVGLAAPQIGISKRIILVDVAANGKGGVGHLKIFINPEIIWKSKEEGGWYEGCFSTGNICGIVSRATKIKVKGFSLQPLRLHRRVEQTEEEYSGYTARIFQHEIDHLNGIRFPDLIKDPDKLHWVEKDEFPLYRDRQAWRSWNKKCEFQTWKKIKGE